MNNKALNDRIIELERKRSVSLARQQWSVVIDLEARIEECKLWRKRLETQTEIGGVMYERTTTPTPS